LQRIIQLREREKNLIIKLKNKNDKNIIRKLIIYQM